MKILIGEKLKTNQEKSVLPPFALIIVRTVLLLINSISAIQKNVKFAINLTQEWIKTISSTAKKGRKF